MPEQPSSYEKIVPVPAPEKPAGDAHVQEILSDKTRDPHELLAQLAAESQQAAVSAEPLAPDLETTAPMEAEGEDVERLRQHARLLVESLREASALMQELDTVSEGLIRASDPEMAILSEGLGDDASPAGVEAFATALGTVLRQQEITFEGEPDEATADLLSQLSAAYDSAKENLTLLSLDYDLIGGDGDMDAFEDLNRQLNQKSDLIRSQQQDYSETAE